MPFTLDGARVKLEGPCSVEEASDLHQALIALERPLIDLEAATHVHTAVAQVLIASRGRLTKAPQDSALAAALASLEIAS